MLFKTSDRSSTQLKRIALLQLILMMLFAESIRADALNFFNNWFVTGDYAVAGVGLAASGGQGTINMTGVPDKAYPIAAFLYWQTVESGATATGAAGLLDGNKISGRLLGSDSTSACWLASTPSQTLRVYRADVLRFLPIDPATHLRRVSGSHSVALGEGNGNSGVLRTEGASLVVIYRVVAPGNPAIAPLRSIVIYDGVYTLSNSQPSMTQKIFGFYDAAANPAATMTHIVGNGQAAFQATLKVNGAVPSGVDPLSPLVGAQGPNWDNLKFPISLSVDDSSTETKVVVAGNSSDCLSWGAVVTSTNVQDSDGDGLLDIWEKNGVHRNTQVSPATFGTCPDYPTEPCVNLPAMGAKNGVKDIFVQLDWMHGYGDATGGVDGTGYHSHIPKLEALSMVAKAFAARNVALHFDVGNNYQGLGLPYIIPYATDAYGNQLAQGGSDLDESTLVCHNQTCAYQAPYPVLSFKLGFLSVKDGNHLLNIPPHFAPIRRDVFHYALFAHAVAGPFDTTGKPAAPNPKSISGIGDRPGGDLMVTLGLWRSDIPANDQVGSVLVQAGTLMHELGHNLGLSHAGSASVPNCMPNYPSVMSYLYQTRGLTDGNGVAQVDYSSGLLAGLNENSPTAFLGALPYRVRFYGPLNNLNSPRQAAKVHCDGTPITNGALSVRLEGNALSTPDWSNGAPAAFPLDLNFDGISGQTFTDQPDWSSLNLQQIGSRTSFGSISVGSLATDAGSLATDAGSLATDAGSLATDAGSLATDAGSLATDAGSLATDAGSLATDAGDEDYDSHILSATDPLPGPQQCTGCGLSANNELSGIRLSWTPPATGAGLTYNIYRCAGTNCTPSAPALITGWNPASKSAPTFTDAVNDPVHAGASCPATATCYNTVYSYSVTAVSSGGIESAYSNTASSEVTHLFVIADSQTVTYGSPNPTPTFQIYGDIAGSLSKASVVCAYNGVPRNAGSYAITCSGPASTSPTDGVTYNAPYLTFTPGTLTISPRPITVTAAAASKTYDGTTASTAVPSLTLGTLAYSDPATWTESYDDPNTGTTHVMTPAGSVADGNGGANYAVTFVAINTGVILKATAAITVNPYNVAYDGNSHLATGTATGVLNESLTGLDLSGTVHTNAGTYPDTWTFTNRNYADASGTVTDVISKADATITVTPYAVTYDENAHTATGSATGVKGEALGGLVLNGTTHINAGSYATDPWSFTDSTGNYKNATGTVSDSIAKATPVVVVIPYEVVFDGNPHSATGTATGVKGESLAGLDLSATVHTNPGSYADAWTFTDTAGNYKNAAGNVTDVIHGFVATGSMSTPRSYHTATLLNGGKVLVAGGFDGKGNALATAELYDPKTGGFAAAGGAMPNKAAGATATLLGNGKVLVVGGGNSNANLYDPSTNTFSSAGGTGVQRTYHTAVLLANGKVLIAGGSDNSGKPQNSAQIYDPVTGVFTATGNMTVARDFHTATLLPDGRVLIAGGRTLVSKSYAYVSSAEIYDPNTGVFTTTGAMTTARYAHTALLYNGKVLIAGGANSTAVLASAEVYDPATGAFSATGPLAAARQYFTASAVNGGVLQAGGLGSDGKTGLKSAEQYQGGIFTSAGIMREPRSAHTATVLTNGSVLVVGGQGSAGISVASAEIFH